MVHAFVFLTNLDDSQDTSFYATEIDSNHSTRKLIAAMRSCLVPDIVVQICQSLRPHSLDVRSRLKFTPSYGSCIFEYDVHRLPSPAMLLLGHNALTDPTRDVTAYRDWLNSDIIRRDDNSYYKVVNLIGGIYQRAQNAQNVTNSYNNWLVRSLRRLADSATHRKHLRQHDILTFDDLMYNDVDNFNPYAYLLMTDRARLPIALDFIKSLSSFCSRELNANAPLDSLLNSTSSEITRHQIHGTTFPTWYFPAIVNFDPTVNTPNGNFRDLCNVIHFGTRANPSAPEAVPYPANHALVDANLYPVKNIDHDTAVLSTPPDEDFHSHSEVLLFDPYDDEPSAHLYTLFSGKLISNKNVDAQALPLPKPSIALSKKNRVM